MTPQEQDELERLGKLFQGASDVELRELVLESLRRWHRAAPGALHFSLHGELGSQLVPLLGERSNLPVNDRLQQWRYLVNGEEKSQRWMAQFRDCIDWVERVGAIAPVYPRGGGGNGYPYTYRLTPAGARLLESTDDHPLLPGHVDRLRARCAGLPDPVVALLIDSHDCLEHMLLRPAVVVMGIAYEAAIEAVVESLITRTTLLPEAREQNAAVRISRVRGVIDQVIPASTSPQRDDRFAVKRAYDFADDLRRRRNDASHTAPRYDFSERAEVEEFLVSAARNLPLIWKVFA